MCAAFTCFVKNVCSFYLFCKKNVCSFYLFYEECAQLLPVYSRTLAVPTHSMCSSYLFCQQNVQLLPDLSITHVASTCFVNMHANRTHFVKIVCSSYLTYQECV